MKARNDFVSNSSSCSFVVAVNGTYSIKDFAKDVAKNTVNSKSQYHDKDLKRRNQTILEFCLGTYELLFLGYWTLKTEERTMTLEKSIEIHGKEYGEYEFQLCLKDVKRRKKLNEKAADGRMDYVDKDNVIHWFVDKTAGDIIVSHSMMDREFSPKYLDDDRRLANLSEYAKENIEDSKGNLWDETPEIYQITQNTIDNTKLLLKNGIKLDFDKWENIKSLEKRIKAGEKIYGITLNYEGGGYDTYAIYAEENCEDVLNGIAAEELHGELA